VSVSFRRGEGTRGRFPRHRWLQTQLLVDRICCLGAVDGARASPACGLCSPPCGGSGGRWAGLGWPQQAPGKAGRPARCRSRSDWDWIRRADAVRRGPNLQPPCRPSEAGDSPRRALEQVGHLVGLGVDATGRGWVIPRRRVFRGPSPDRNRTKQNTHRMSVAGRLSYVRCSCFSPPIRAGDNRTRDPAGEHSTAPRAP